MISLARPATALLAAALVACSPPRVERAPADVTFSIGIVDGNPGVAVAGGAPGNLGAPQTATTVHLKFAGGTRGPFTVVAERLAKPATSERPVDWTSIPDSTVPLVPAAEAVGMAKEVWNTEFQAAQGYLQVWDYGIYYVRIKAAYDDQRLYLQLQWADSTPSVGRRYGVSATLNWAVSDTRTILSATRLNTDAPGIARPRP